MLLLLVLLAGRVAADPPVQYDAEQTRDEIKMGREATHDFDKKIHLIQHGPQIERLRRILKRLVPHSGRPDLPYSVKLIDDKTVNAITFPGGFIYVFRGLLDQKPSDDMLACVLGHEVTHAARSHTYRKLLQMKALGFLTGGSDGILSATTKILLLNGVGRTYENQADRVGLHVAADAGYDPRAMIATMQMLERVEKEHPGLLTSLIATHPPLPDRIKKIQAELAAMHRS